MSNLLSIFNILSYNSLKNPIFPTISYYFLQLLTIPYSHYFIQFRTISAKLGTTKGSPLNTYNNSK